MTKRMSTAAREWLQSQPLKTRMRFGRARARTQRKHRRWRDHHDWYLKLLVRQMSEEVRTILACPIEERRFYDMIELKVRTPEKP